MKGAFKGLPIGARDAAAQLSINLTAAGAALPRRGLGRHLGPVLRYHRANSRRLLLGGRA